MNAAGTSVATCNSCDAFCGQGRVAAAGQINSFILGLPMDQLTIISDSGDCAGHIGRALAGIFETQSILRRDLADAKPSQHAIVDINLTYASHLSDLRHWLMCKPKRGRAIFAVDPGIRREAAQAYAVGATDLLARPLDRKMLLATLLGDLGALAKDPVIMSTGKSAGISAGISALEGIFDSVVSGSPIEWKKIDAAGHTLVVNIEEEGLPHWIDVVRKHHSQTYQHCLLVTGVAVAFGRHLGFSNGDKQKLAFAGLLHDLGKAGIPVAVLEKPGPLNGDEVTVMRRHPQLGFERLRGMRGLDPEMLDMVLHHHEYLDGSGYPHGLQAGELSDLVRLMTIADIYGALIERRAYRAPLTREAAFHFLNEMGPKLDRDLVRAFRSFALTTRVAS
jgi:putative nucleotidyltransferase with HDIG domain